MHKAVRNRPLTPRQKLTNQLISKQRYIIEQCFGTAKEKAQLTLKYICINLLKAANKIEEIFTVTGEIRLLNR